MMTKHCIVCEAEAKYKIKATSDYYCLECAKEHFSDIDLLVTVEEEAQQLKTFLENQQRDENELSDN